MSRFQIKPAVRKGQKARVALSSPSGGGKTWTALEIATVLAGDGRLLVIDTERGEASLYADDFAFDTIEWTPPFSPLELAQTIREVHGDFAVILVDSLSHFWKGPGGTLSIVDDNAPKGNSYVGWKVGSEAQDEMVTALTSAECHLIATMRSKTEYVLETNDRGKQVPRKVGMAPVQRDDLDYEFTVTGELDKEHTLRIDKTRCSALADRAFTAGHAHEMATILLDWLDSAAPLATVKQRRDLQDRLDNLGKCDRASIRPTWKDRGYDLARLLSSEVEDASALIAKFEPDVANEPTPQPPHDAIHGRLERLTPRSRAKAVQQANQAGLPMTDLSDDQAVAWDALLDKLEASQPPPFPDPDETGVPGDSNEAS